MENLKFFVKNLFIYKFRRRFAATYHKTITIKYKLFHKTTTHNVRGDR